MNEDKVYDIDNIPEDAEVFTGKSRAFEPIDASEMYQVELQKIELKDNVFYKPDAKKVEEKGSKYQFSFEFAIINEGPFYGRRIWDTTSLAFKPTTKRGPTKLYKIVMAAINQSYTWEQCQDFCPDTRTFYKNLKEQLFVKQLKISIENITNPETQKVRSKVVAYYPVKSELPSFDPEKVKAMMEDFPDKEEVKKPEKKSVTKDVSPDDLPF
jgi:hypothetical protein